MKNKHITLAAGFALLLIVPLFAIVPSSVRALTADEIQQQVTVLLAQIAKLQEQLKSLQATNSTPVSVGVAQTACPTLFRSLTFGAQGSDVLSLQEFLLAQNLLGTGATKGYFDSITESAVQRLQVQYGVVVSGTPATTGYGIVGPRTRSLIALNCKFTPAVASCPIAQPPTSSCSAGWQANTDSLGCVTSYKCSIPLPTATPPVGACTAIALLCPVGMHDEVGANCSHRCAPNTSQPSSLSVTPMAGAAPLLVTFALSATDSTDSNGIYYTIEFGDGQATSFTRTANPSLMHTYTSTGTYTAKVIRRTGCSSWECSGVTTTVGTVTIVVVGSVSSGMPFSISSPTSGQSVQQGQTFAISWNSQNAPTGSAVSLWLVKSNGVPLGLITRNQPVSGTFTWQVPGSKCNASGVCVSLVDSPSAYYTDLGSYWIVGNVYTPADAYLGGFPPANPVMPSFLATATSSLFSIVGGSGTGSTFSASPASGSAPLVVTFSGTVNSAGYSIDFGDGTLSGDIGCVHGGCPSKPSTSAVNVNHTYSSKGTYVAKLRQHFQSNAGNCYGIDCNVVGTTTVTVSSGLFGSCPVYSPPLCNDNQHLVGGAYNATTGCYGSPYCVAN